MGVPHTPAQATGSAVDSELDDESHSLFGPNTPSLFSHSHSHGLLTSHESHLSTSNASGAMTRSSLSISTTAAPAAAAPAGGSSSAAGSAAGSGSGANIGGDPGREQSDKEADLDACFSMLLPALEATPPGADRADKVRRVVLSLGITRNAASGKDTSPTPLFPSLPFSFICLVLAHIERGAESVIIISVSCRLCGCAYVRACCRVCQHVIVCSCFIGA